MTFFMEVLARELSNARRNKYDITLITIIISNFDEATKDLHPEEEIEIIQIIQNAIFRTLREWWIISLPMPSLRARHPAKSDDRPGNRRILSPCGKMGFTRS